MGSWPVEARKPEVFGVQRKGVEFKSPRGRWLSAHLPVITAACVATAVVAFAFSGIGPSVLDRLYGIELSSIKIANAVGEARPWADLQFGASLLKAGAAFQPPDIGGAAQSARVSGDIPAVTVLSNTSTPVALQLAAETDVPASIPLLYAVIVSGLPDGSRISRGTPLGHGEWALALDDLGQLVIDLPASTTKPVQTRIDIAGRDGSVLASFPFVLLPKKAVKPGVVGTPTILSPIRNEGVTAKARQRQTSLDSTWGAVPKAKDKPTKAAKSAQAATKPLANKTVAEPVAAAEALAVMDGSEEVGMLSAGSAGFETFKGLATSGSAVR